MDDLESFLEKAADEFPVDFPEEFPDETEIPEEPEGDGGEGREKKGEEDEEDELIIRKKKKKKKEKKKKREKEREEASPSPAKRKREEDDGEDDFDAGPVSEIVASVAPEVSVAPGKMKAKKKKKKAKQEEEDNNSDIRSELAPLDEDLEMPEEPLHISAREQVLSALRNGLPGKFFTPEEHKVFRTTRTDVEMRKHLYTRNHAMKLWEDNPKMRLYLSDLRTRVSDKSQLQAAHSVFTFLEETGVINCGAPKERYKPISNKRTVCVIGAGLSGLMAAQQLRRSGFEVTVLEGRHEVGGRCRTVTLQRGGEAPVGPPNRHDVPEMLLDRFLDTGGDEEPADDTRSMHSGVEALVPIGANDPVASREASVASADTTANALTREPVDPPHAALYHLLKQIGVDDTYWVNMAQKKRNDESSVDLHIFDPEGKPVDAEDPDFLEVENKLNMFMEHQIRDTETLAACEDFLRKQGGPQGAKMCAILAAMELATHARIDMIGKHEAWRGGQHNVDVIPVQWKQLCRHLTANLSVECGTVVSDIRHTDKKVTVCLMNGERRDFDNCVVTVPLGVLQAGLIRFHPELPEAKVQAINSIGMGVRNTLVLEFDRAFWVEQEVAPDTYIEQGDFMLQTDPANSYRGVGVRGQFEASPPHIILSLSGHSAELAEEGGAQQLVEEVMQHLKKVFPGVQVPDEPTHVNVSAWRNDTFSCGSAPYRKPDTTDEHFHELSRPVGNNGRGPLFFAGDATDDKYYGSLAGAVASGVRAAREVSAFYRHQLQAGWARKAAVTGEERLRELAMYGTAPRLTDRRKGAHGKETMMRIAAETEGALQHSRGSSRNLAAKYATNQAVPTMQRNLFNTFAKPDGESKIRQYNSYANRAAQKAVVAGQAALAKLEKVTEQRWRQAKAQKNKELAKGILKDTPASPTDDGKKGKQVVQSRVGAVDDALPTWYYQTPQAQAAVPVAENHQTEFASTFFKSAHQRKAESERETKEAYIRDVRGVVLDALLRHSEPKRVKASKKQIRIYSKLTLERTKELLGTAVIQRFQDSYAHKTGREFQLGDWKHLPDVASAGVRSAIRAAVDRQVEAPDFEDPHKADVVKKLGYDPNERLFQKKRAAIAADIIVPSHVSAPEAAEGGNRSLQRGRSDVTSVVPSFVPEPHLYSAADELPDARYSTVTGKTEPLDNLTSSA